MMDWLAAIGAAIIFFITAFLILTAISIVRLLLTMIADKINAQEDNADE